MGYERNRQTLIFVLLLTLLLTERCGSSLCSVSLTLTLINTETVVLEIVVFFQVIVSRTTFNTSPFYTVEQTNKLPYRSLSYKMFVDVDVNFLWHHRCKCHSICWYLDLGGFVMDRISSFYLFIILSLILTDFLLIFLLFFFLTTHIIHEIRRIK